MKTKVLRAITALLIISSPSAFAQSAANGRFSIGVEGAFSAGNFTNTSNVGFGGSLRYEMPVGNNLGIMLTAGFLEFGSKTVEGDVSSIKYTNSVIPIQLGAKYYFMSQQKGFYVGVEAGVHLLTSKALGDDASGTQLFSFSGNSTAFSYDPLIGYHLDNLDFGFKYQLFTESFTTEVGGTSYTSTSSASYLDLRIAYVFGGK